MVVLILATAVAAAVQDVDPAPPGPIEQAVIEHRCAGSRAGISASADPYHDCLARQLAGLRADFGADLKQLTPADRRKLDAACSRVRTFEGRERYVACLSDRLAARQGDQVLPPSVPLLASASDVAAVPVVPASAGTPSARSSAVLPIALAAVIVVGAAGGGAYFFLKRPRRPSACHACGLTFEEPGDLCPACRHEAAEARRRTALEREDQARAAKDETARHEREAAEHQRLRVLEEEERRQRLDEERVRTAVMERLEQERRREEEREERSRFGSAADRPADPHQVLGVSPGAGVEELRSAYDQARARYAPDVVAHLSEEVQAHYRAKADAVDRAYRELTASP